MTWAEMIDAVAEDVGDVCARIEQVCSTLRELDDLAENGGLKPGEAEAITVVTTAARARLLTVAQEQTQATGHRNELARAREAAEDCGRGEALDLVGFIEGLGANIDAIEVERDKLQRRARELDRIAILAAEFVESDDADDRFVLLTLALAGAGCLTRDDEIKKHPREK